MVGISESAIQKNTLIDLLKAKAYSVVDSETDFGITISGSTVNLGKDIIDLLSEQYHKVRGGLLNVSNVGGV
jgi:hypothetical protein